MSDGLECYIFIFNIIFMVFQLNTSRNYKFEVRLIVSFPDSCQLDVGPVLLTLNTRFRLLAAHLHNFTVRRSQLPWAMKTAARVWVNINFDAKKCRHPLLDCYTVDTLAKHFCIFSAMHLQRDFSIYMYIFVCICVSLLTSAQQYDKLLRPFDRTQHDIKPLMNHSLCS